ncbi:MAG: SRPBCC domain-containing protein [Cyclobacteriaceae bacterium]
MPDFKKYYVVPALPEEVFAGLTFKPTIELWTGFAAEFKLEKGAEFSMWDGDISGKVLDFEHAKMLQEQWYFGEQQENSIVTLKFHEHKKGTSLEVHHTNIPAETYDDIVDGWSSVFMKELIDFYKD